MSFPGVRMKRQGLSRGQRFIKADYYELDWYYDECTDGKAAGGSCRDIQLAHGHVWMQKLLAVLEIRAAI